MALKPRLPSQHQSAAKDRWMQDWDRQQTEALRVVRRSSAGVAVAGEEGWLAEPSRSMALPLPALPAPQPAHPGWHPGPTGLSSCMLTRTAPSTLGTGNTLAISFSFWAH